MTAKLIRKLLIVLTIQSMVLFISTGNMDLFHSSISGVIDYISSNSIIIGIILFIVTTIGLTFKNKHSYFKSWLSYISVIGLVTSDSLIMTGKIAPFELTSYWLMVSLFSFILLTSEELHNTGTKYPFKEQKNKELDTNLGNDSNGDEEIQINFNPIESLSKLFPSRQRQLNQVTEYIKGCSNDSHYSICIDGDYGSGKTSFVNVLLKELDSDKYHTIFINTLAIDSFETLTEYFIGCVNRILVEKNIYIGFNSEYKDLITELTKSFSSSTANLLTKINMPVNNDLRNTFKKINCILSEVLKNDKIVVVIDDIERCNKKLALQYLFFVKEISSLYGCITIYVTDYCELKKKCKYDDFFFEKFFNCIFHLIDIKDYEILSAIQSDKDFNERFLSVIRNIKQKANDSISKSTFTINNETKDSNNKETTITDLISDFERSIRNPRKLLKIYEKYLLLNSIVKNNVTDSIEELKKIGYKDQLMLLSIIYVIDNKAYSIIESQGVFEFLHFISDSKETHNQIVAAISEEWDDNNGNISNKKTKFIYYLFSSPSELSKAINGLTLKQQEYKEIIASGILTENDCANFVDVINEISLIGTGSSGIIKDAFVKYSDYISLDQALPILNSNTILYSAENASVAQSFLYAFCNTHVKVDDKERCIHSFKLAQKNQLSKYFRELARYLYCLVDNEEDFMGKMSNIPLVRDEVDQSIDQFCYHAKTITKLNSLESVEPANKLIEIIKRADDFYAQNNMSNLKDLKIFRQQINNIIEEIVSLKRIEDYINSKEAISINYKIDDIEKAISKIYDEVKDNPNRFNEYYDYLNLLFNKIENNKPVLSEVGLKKLNDIIELWAEAGNKPDLSWRNIWFKASKKVQDKSRLK